MNIDMNIKRKTLRYFAGLLVLCLAGLFALAGCPNLLVGPPAEQSAAPTAAITVIPITGTQLSVEIPLTSTHTGVWKIYDSAGRPAGDTSVFFTSSPSPKLLMNHRASFLVGGDYRITVTESGKSESNPLVISLRAPSSAPALAEPLATVVELTDGQTSVTFTLDAAAAAIAGEWRVYGEAQGGVPLTTARVTVNNTTLTLAAIPESSPLAGGIYYVGVTINGQAESARLALTVNAYDANRTALPAVSQAAVVKVAKPTAQAVFTLTGSYTSATWKVYAAPTGPDAPTGVSVEVSSTTLTLKHGTDIPMGTYYVTATEAGKTESSRQPLGVTLPDSITFTAETSSVSGTASPGGSVSATTTGSPSYSTVNGLNVLTFNNDAALTDGGTDVPAAGDFVSLNAIVGDYMPEDDWTMELIVKENTASTGKILNFWGANGWQRAGSLWLENNTNGYWLFRVWNAQSVNKGVGISRPSTDAWHHVAYVRTGGTVTCYVDGTLAGSANAGNPNTTFNETPNTYFENPAMAQITNCLVGLRNYMQFHQFKISKGAITPSNNSGYYNDAKVIVNTLTGAQTDRPQVSSATYTKSGVTQPTAAFTLTNSYTPPVTWKVYDANTDGSIVSGVTASSSGNTLTLAHASDIPANTYFVSAAEAGKRESDRLALTIVNHNAQKTATPAVSQTNVVKVTKPTASVSYTLTNLTEGSITWRLYTENAGGTEWGGVSATSSGNTLTLAGTDVPVGTYYMSATKSGDTESDRLTLTVSLPDSIDFTVGNNSVTGTASSGGSVSATVNGSTYGPVNGSSYYGLTFTTAATFDSSVPNAPSGGGYLSLNPIVGDYMPEDNWTMEMIMQLQGDSSVSNFMEFWGASGRSNAGSLWLETRNANTPWLFRVYNASGASNKGVRIKRPDDSKWHHVVYVRTNGTVTCYVDGVQATVDGEGNPNPNTTFNDAANTYFENPAMAQITYCLIGTQANSHIHQFKISKTAITPSGNSSYYNSAKVMLNTLNSVKTAAPDASVTTYTKTQSTETVVAFTLTNSYTDPVTWKVYTHATNDTLASGVTASLISPTLTLTHGSNIPAGTYYVAAAETGTGKLESDRLALTVAAYGVPQTPPPTVSNAGFVKVAKPTTQAAYTLTNLTSGTIAWKVYAANEGSTPASGVTASSNSSTLTLAGTDVPVGTYYVSATEDAKTESGRLVLTVSLPDSIIFTVDSNSVTGTASPGGSVSAAVNGSPTYGQVNSSSYYGLTFNTDVVPGGGTGAVTGGDFVSLHPIVGDYMPEDNWTMELIVKTGTASTGQILNFWGTGGRNVAGSFWIEYHTGGGYWLFRVYDSGGNKGVKINKPSADWHHVAYVRTGGTVTCYVDGTQATGGDTGNPNPNTTYNDAANTYFENPAMSQITNCLIGMRKDMLFHQFKISKTAITPSSNSSYYNSAKAIVDALNSTGK